MELDITLARKGVKLRLIAQVELPLLLGGSAPVPEDPWHQMPADEVATVLWQAAADEALRVHEQLRGAVLMASSQWTLEQLARRRAPAAPESLPEAGAPPGSSS